MSLPPQIIRVKRKRVEEAPVTFLQLDDENKRHRTGSNWIYQRRNSTVQPQSPPNFRHDAKPVIHISEPQDAKGSHQNQTKPQIEAPISPLKRSADLKNETRRFHVSRTMLSAANESVFKGGRRGPALFVERTRRKKLIAKTRRSMGGPSLKTEVQDDTPIIGPRVEQKDLKKPGLANRARSRENMKDSQNRNPLPPSLMNRQDEDMNKIASDMNEWVLREVGANLESMEEEKRKQAKPRFKPKAPEKRYPERHPETAVAPGTDINMSNAPGSEASDEEGDDDEWVIEEYVRMPANTMKHDVLPSEVGFLVLEGEQESLLFYGHPNDEDDDLDEDEEDENAENHYTADYPEEEAESDDELYAYWNRNRNASDEEEFDQDDYDDDDEIAMEGDDDDARMARIVDRIRRQRIASERYP